MKRNGTLRSHTMLYNHLTLPPNYLDIPEWKEADKEMTIFMNQYYHKWKEKLDLQFDNGYTIK